MKKYLLILFSTFLFAKTTIDGITIYNLPSYNKTNETNITKQLNVQSYNESNTINPYETNETNETNNTQIVTFEEIFNSNIKTIKPSIDIAVIIDKKLFSKYLPSIINSLNSYFLYKHTEFNLTVYDINQTQEALKHKNIIFYTYDPNSVYALRDYNNTFYFPMINQNDINVTNSNFYFGGINYESQIKKLGSLIEDTNYTIAINDDTLTSQKLFSIENKTFNAIPYNYQNINFNDLNNTYVFLNTSPQKSAQILSNIYYQNVEPNLILSTQINYTPLLIALTQTEALNKLIIANSIINPPKELADINMLLNSDIKFNWLNYASDILCNKIYNDYSKGDIYFMNDFLVYIFNNQINYNTELYQIIFKGFKKILIP